MRRLLPTLLALLALALVPGAAPAAVVPGQVIDPASADIVRFGDLDLAPDGTGALVYVKKVGGVDHVFASRYVNATWSAPEQLDTGAISANRPSVAAADGGRVVVTFLSGNGAGPYTLRSAIRQSPAQSWNVPMTGISDGSVTDDVKMAPNGTAYVTFTTTNAGDDVRAYRLAGTTWTPVGAAYPSDAGILNFDKNQPAGQPNTMDEPRVAVTNDGNAAVTWAEVDASMNHHVYARRLNGTTLGNLAEATVPALNGKPTAGGEESDIDVDATGQAWVVFRESFTYGMTNHARALVRSFGTNGTFGPVQVADDFSEAPTENAEFPRLDVNPAGQGLIAVNPQNPGANTNRDLFSALAGGAWSQGAPVNTVASDGQTFPVAALGDQGAGVVAWQQTQGMNPVTALARQRVNGQLGSVLTLSRPELGTVAMGPFEEASDAKGNVAVGFAQGAANKAVVAAVIDGPPPSVMPPPGGDKTAPTLASVSLSASVFRLGSLLPKLSAKKRKAIPTGTTIRFRVDEDSTTTLSFKRLLPGRRVGKRCLAATRARRRKARCTRLVPAGRKLTFQTPKGLNRIRFQGRFSRRSKLAPGSYEVTIVAVDAAKNASKPVRKRFTLRPALKPKR